MSVRCFPLHRLGQIFNASFGTKSPTSVYSWKFGTGYITLRSQTCRFSCLKLTLFFVDLFLYELPSSSPISPGIYPNPLLYHPPFPSPSSIHPIVYLLFRVPSSMYIYHYFIPSSLFRDMYVHISLPLITQLPTYLFTCNGPPTPLLTTSHFSVTMPRIGCFQASLFPNLRLNR